MSGGQRVRVTLARAIYDYPNEAGEGTNVFLLDDPFSSTDPKVGFNIFKNLLGPEGLIRNAAVIMTIDETSLHFFLDSLAASGSRLSVDLKTHMIEKGVLSETVQSAYTSSKAVMELQPPTLQSQQPNKTLPSSSPPTATFSEQTFSGAVGKQTYLWYMRYVGFGIIFLMGLVILLIVSSHTGSDLW